MNAKRIYRLYKGLGLQLRNKTPKRRVKAKLRDERRPAVQANETWAMDFVHDEGIWLVSFMHYDLGYIDLEQEPCNPSTTRSARGCHPSLRNRTSPKSPGQTQHQTGAAVGTGNQHSLGRGSGDTTPDGDPTSFRTELNRSASM